MPASAEYYLSLIRELLQTMPQLPSGLTPDGLFKVSVEHGTIDVGDVTLADITVADGGDTAQGSKSDAPAADAVQDTTAYTSIALLKLLVNLLRAVRTDLTPGQALMAASVPVAVASNQTAVPISASALPLPSGAATETTLGEVSEKLTHGQTTMAASVPVAIANNQTAVPISASALPLPSGAATETSLDAINDKVPSQGQALMAASVPVAIASNQTAVPVSAAALPLPSGAATESTLSKQLDITLSDFRDALAGAGAAAKTLADVVTKLNGGLPAALGAGGGVKIDGSGTALPMSLSSLPSLATGSNDIGGVKLVDLSGAVQGVNVQAGQLVVTSQPYMYAIAEGDITSHVHFTKIGSNAAVGTGIVPIWEVGTAIAFPPSAAALEVVSSNVNDTAAGSGIRTVTLQYLDNAYVVHSETIALNGTGAVATAANNILRVLYFRAASTGANKVAAGNIDIRGSGGGTVYGRISTGYTAGRAARWTVPADKTAYLTKIALGVSVPGNTYKAARAVLYANYDPVTAATGLGFYLPQWEAAFSYSCIDALTSPIKLPERTDFYLAAVVDTTTASIQATIDGWYE